MCVSGCQFRRFSDTTPIVRLYMYNSWQTDTCYPLDLAYGYREESDFFSHALHTLPRLDRLPANATIQTDYETRASRVRPSTDVILEIVLRENSFTTKTFVPHEHSSFIPASLTLLRTFPSSLFFIH